jgi:arylsulfatase A-like enzyme
VDDCVRELFDIFETAGVLDRSVIFFASDHGDEFGEHGGLSHDGKMYSELVGVPLFIWNRDKAGGAIYNKPVSNIDISPTIAHLFELGRVGGFKGSSLLPTEGLKTGSCFGEAINKRGHREKKEDGPIYYCLRGSRKIIFNRTNGSWELYDLENDPGERTNLIETGENAGELREELEAFLQDRPQE